MVDDAVTVAYIHPDEISQSFSQSLMGMVAHDIGSRGRIARGGWIAVRCHGADGIPAARNMVAAQFLADKDAEWLFFVDSDMGFAPDTVDRLLAVADPTTRPIVGALCFAQKADESDGMGGWRMRMAPTVFDWVGRDNGESGFLSRRDYPVNTLIQVAGTGSAAILIHRSVFERVRDQYGEAWYSRVVNPTAGHRLFGEDLSFCLRAGAVGIPIHVHTGVRTTHYKPVWLSEADYWHLHRAEPAAEQVAVIVPVMRRPDNAEPFMRSLRASTGLATVYAICDEDDSDTIQAWQKAGARKLLWRGDEPGTFAQKVNLGYQRTKEPWIFLVGDDVRFHAGWLDQAQSVAGDQFHVVGTNDLTNPRTLAGEHATHLLVRRSYVDEHGASWDGPKVVAHEGYRHWYVDDEIVRAAQQRSAFAVALGSIVEHIHPMVGKAEDDDVYRLGQAHAAQDGELFRNRVTNHAS